MLLFYIVDIMDHEGLLALLLGAADVPEQRQQLQQPFHPKGKVKQPARRDMQTEGGQEHPQPEPQIPLDVPHQETHPTADDVEPATECRQQLLWILLTDQGSHMAVIRKYKTKLVGLMDQLVNIAKHSYMLEIKGKISDENIIFANDIIHTTKELMSELNTLIYMAEKS